MEESLKATLEFNQELLWYIIEPDLSAFEMDFTI